MYLQDQPITHPRSTHPAVVDALSRNGESPTSRSCTRDRAAVVDSAREGDPAAWELLLREYAGMLSATARRYRLNDAQAADAVQTTWLRLLEHIDDVREPERLPGWLATTARRICLQAAKEADLCGSVDDSNGREPAVSAADDDHSGPEAAVLRDEQVSLVREALAELPERQRHLMELVMSSPAPSYHEIASRLDMPVGSIGPTRARVLAKMRVRLVAMGLDEAVLS